MKAELVDLPRETRRNECEAKAHLALPDETPSTLPSRRKHTWSRSRQCALS